MKYSVIVSRVSPPRVVITYPFRWMATVMAAAYGGEKNGFDVAITPTDAQSFINVCTHRDDLAQNLHEVVDALMTLVARDEKGVWTTLHDADTPVSDDTAALLDRLTAA
jgi:hypothetical protein